MPCMLRGWSRCRPPACGNTVQRPSTAWIDRLRTCPALQGPVLQRNLHTFCRALHSRMDRAKGTCSAAVRRPCPALRFSEIFTLCISVGLLIIVADVRWWEFICWVSRYCYKNWSATMISWPAGRGRAGTGAPQCGGRAFAPAHARVCAAPVSSRSLKLFHIELKIRPRNSEFLGLGAVLWR